MRRIKCIDGLELTKVMFRHELADLVRHETKSRVDYIRSIEIDRFGIYTIYFMVGISKTQYSCQQGFSTKHGLCAKKIVEFTKANERNSKLEELGI